MTQAKDLLRFADLKARYDSLNEMEFKLYMRFRTFPWTNEGCGVRVKTFFAFLPVCSDDEIRWLRKVTVRQLWYLRGWDGDGGYWKTVDFIDQKESK